MVRTSFFVIECLFQIHNSFVLVDVEILAGVAVVVQNGVADLLVDSGVVVVGQDREDRSSELRRLRDGDVVVLLGELRGAVVHVLQHDGNRNFCVHPGNGVGGADEEFVLGLLFEI
jgi:hypothetical protein